MCERATGKNQEVLLPGHPNEIHMLYSGSKPQCIKW